jgi:hypothetical protein
MPNMSDERAKLIEKLLKPDEYTLEQVYGLLQEQHAWLEKHPDDIEVLEIGESLVMMRDWLEGSNEVA